MTTAAYYSMKLPPHIWTAIGVGLLILAAVAIGIVINLLGERYAKGRPYDWQREKDFESGSLTTGELTFVRKQQASDAGLAMASLFRALDEPGGRERVRALFVEQAQERKARDDLNYPVHHPKDAA